MPCVGVVCLVDPAELLAGGEVGDVSGVVRFWDSAIACLLVVGEVLSGTAGTLSLPLLDRTEVVSE